MKAAEGPPAHNPQPIHKKATHSFKSFQSLNSFTFFVWLVVEELLIEELIKINIITVIGRYKDSMHVVTIFNTRSN